jgi:hypothetical protein
MLPPDSATLIPRVIRRNARRARELAARLDGLAETREEREACRALHAALGAIRGVERAEFYLAPETRAWLAAAEEALAMARPPEADLALFDRVAAGPHLRALLPEGKLDGRLRQRTMALGERLLRRAFRALPPVVSFLTPPGQRFGPFPLDASPDGEQSRRRGELHLRFPLPATLRVRPGASLELVDGGVRLRQPGRGAGWKPREVIEGTGIVLAGRVRATRRGLRPGPRLPGLARRLGEAMRLVREAWPAAADEVLVHTWEMVPLAERGTVSYSLPSRPGTSYINVVGKRVIDLADDLVHETAHHRLHSLEEITPLHRAGDDAVYYSPWRRSMRPLHGILHAAYTFSFRAELLERLLRRRPGRLPRAWMRREVERELAMLRRSLVDLEDARDRGLLTAAGAGLLRAMSRNLARLARLG